MKDNTAETTGVEEVESHTLGQGEENTDKILTCRYYIESVSASELLLLFTCLEDVYLCVFSAYNTFLVDSDIFKLYPQICSF